MGKRKKSSRKPAAPKRKDPLDTQFTCLFCHHENSVSVKMEKKEGLAQLSCRICDQRFQSKINHLSEPIDVYSEWIDAADEAEKETLSQRRPAASSSRSRPAAPPSVSDDE
ncbi:Elf1-domain-containing protein [Vararia minispora EC-137]|uniref:Elf1-domain-containing protein n=1 Tax=Vararia minispora EC-137 TaxID=1314806 RepID=A0ACB8QTQ7_9AGAM|nr:Elf1-domain-containing protein [Vararia minispora EC-137]